MRALRFCCLVGVLLEVASCLAQGRVISIQRVRFDQTKIGGHADGDFEASAADQHGNVFALGRSATSTYLCKYSPSGSLLWQKRIESRCRSAKMMVSRSGSVVGALGMPDSIELVKMSPQTGLVAWSGTNSTQHDNNDPIFLQEDPLGNFDLAFSMGEGESTHGFMQFSGSNGRLRWQEIPCWGFTFDKKGDTLLGTFSENRHQFELTEFSAKGRKLGAFKYDASSSSEPKFSLLSSGDLVATMYGPSQEYSWKDKTTGQKVETYATQSFAVWKYSPNRQPMWHTSQTRKNRTLMGNEMFVLPNGDVCVVNNWQILASGGIYETSTSTFGRRNGASLWTHVDEGQPNLARAVDSSGNLATVTDQAHGSLITKFRSSDGRALLRVPFKLKQWSSFISAAFDGNGDLLLFGSIQSREDGQGMEGMVVKIR